MTQITAFLTGSDVLPTGSIEFFQPTSLVDTSLEALLGASGLLWGNLLENVRKSVSTRIGIGQIVRFPFLTAPNPGLVSKDNLLYLTAVLANPLQVYLYRSGKDREECAVVQVTSTVLYAETYHHSASRLLLVLSTPTIALGLSDLSQVIWTAGVVPGPCQPLAIVQKRTLETSELVQISVAQDRGLAAILLGDRTLTLLDLEDS